MALDAQNEASVAIPAIVDSTPPASPGNLTGSASSLSSIHLTWTAASDPQSNILQYVIKRGDVEVGWTSDLSFTDDGLTELTQYSYTVTAINGAGGFSVPAGPINVTTLAYTTRPSIVQVTASGGCWP